MGSYPGWLLQYDAYGAKKVVSTVVPTKSDSDVMLCLQLLS